MKSREEIICKIKRLEKIANLAHKHNEKYIELRFKANNSWKDLIYLKARRYYEKALDKKQLYQAAMYQRQGLLWVLDEDN